ncbi:MAG: hypothetical protein AAFY71_22640 [Bacteroidota bacterium]
MKKLWTLIISFFCMLSLSAQEGGRMSFELYPEFQGDTLLVLTYSDSAYNLAIRQSLAEYWNITPVKYVNEKELFKLANSDKYSMLVRDNSQKTRGRSVIKRSHLCIFPCGRSADLTKYGGKYAISQYSIKKIDDSTPYLKKLPFLVKSMQAYIQFLGATENLDEDTFEPELTKWKNQGRTALTDITLVVAAKDLSNGMTESSLKSAYKLPLKVVKNEEIGKFSTMEEGQKALMFLDARKRYLSVIDEKGQLLYHNELANPGELSNKDFKTMSKNAGKPFAEGKSFEARLNKLNKKVNSKLSSTPKEKE